MKHGRYLLYAALLSAIAAAAPACSVSQREAAEPENEIAEEETAEQPSAEITLPPPVEEPVVQKIAYIQINADDVNVRSGAGTGYTVLGSTQKDTLYAYCGREGNWYKTAYKNKDAYIYADYCTVAYMDASENKQVEAVITEGCKCLGVAYVYGATRYLDENGNLISGFTATKFDCSSLMQYIFKLGADANLKLTTRTQIYQGTTVDPSDLRRGDLLFFTNETRKDKTGIERVGHVALYLGGNYILHTASDYAKIERISDTRRDYFIQAQRIL